MRRDLSRSARDFCDVVWPAIRSMCSGGTLIPVESDAESETRTALDVLAGIDAWQIAWSDHRMRGIASRVQWMPIGATPYDTFTVRWRRPGQAQTEVHKRVESMKSAGAWLFPALTVQAYIERDTRELLSVGVVETVALYRWIDVGGSERFSEIRNVDRSSSFKAIPWCALKEDGVRVGVIRSRKVAA